MNETMPMPYAIARPIYLSISSSTDSFVCVQKEADGSAFEIYIKFTGKVKKEQKFMI